MRIHGTVVNNGRGWSVVGVGTDEALLERSHEGGARSRGTEGHALHLLGCELQTRLDDLRGSVEHANAWIKLVGGLPVLDVRFSSDEGVLVRFPHFPSLMWIEPQDACQKVDKAHPPFPFFIDQHRSSTKRTQKSLS